MPHEKKPGTQQDNTMEFTNSQLVYIGGLAVLIVGIVAKQWFTKFVNQKFDDLHAYQVEGKKEREYDNYLSFVGQQVVADNLHELNYAVLHGTHNGELEKANTELDSYRKLLKENLGKKAAKYDIQITKSL